MNNERLMVMRNKIENVGLEDCGVDGGLVAEIIDELIDSRYQIESLTAERDEAREEIERLTEENKRLHDESEVSDSLVLTLQEEVKMLTYERDEARKELTELRTAPGMEEIDAILRGVNSSMFDNQERLASVSRRAIVSREAEKQRAEEAVGLLKWWVSFKDGFGQLEGMSAGSAVEEWKDNARRILEIVEGK